MPSVLDLTEEARKTSAAALRRWEQLAELHLRVAQSCADLGSMQMRGAAQVRDWDSLQAFLANQRMVGSRFREKLANDAREAFHLSVGI